MTISIDAPRCTGCSYCVIGCPPHAIRLDIRERAKPVINEMSCIECGECEPKCPQKIQISEWMSCVDKELGRAV